MPQNIFLLLFLHLMIEINFHHILSTLHNAQTLQTIKEKGVVNLENNAK